MHTQTLDCPIFDHRHRVARRSTRSTFENSSAYNSIVKRSVAKPILGKRISKVRSAFSTFIFHSLIFQSNILLIILNDCTISDDAECELNCKPIGMNYFATMSNTVIDGTTCYTPTDFARRNISGRAMCVDGICKVNRFGNLHSQNYTNAMN